MLKYPDKRKYWVAIIEGDSQCYVYLSTRNDVVPLEKHTLLGKVIAEQLRYLAKTYGDRLCDLNVYEKLADTLENNVRDVVEKGKRKRAGLSYINVFSEEAT